MDAYFPEDLKKVSGTASIFWRSALSAAATCTHNVINFVPQHHTTHKHIYSAVIIRKQPKIRPTEERAESDERLRWLDLK